MTRKVDVYMYVLKVTIQHTPSYVLNRAFLQRGSLSNLAHFKRECARPNSSRGTECSYLYSQKVCRYLDSTTNCAGGCAHAHVG